MDMIQGDINTLLQKRDIELEKYELEPPEVNKLLRLKYPLIRR